MQRRLLQKFVELWTFMPRQRASLCRLKVSTQSETTNETLVVSLTSAKMGRPLSTEHLASHSLTESLPVFSAARAIPDLATSILSAYCSGIRVDFHPPA
jgi:hypothetical protein